eukprot:gene27527-36321_t
MVKKFSSIAMELIYDLLKLLDLEGIIVARNGRFTEFEFPVDEAVTRRKRSSSSRAEKKIELPHQPAKRRNRQASKATALPTTTTTTLSTLPLEIIVIEDNEDDGKEISLPSSSVGEILIAAFARSKGEVPLKEVLLTAREQWPTLSEVSLGKLVAVAEEMNKVMFFGNTIYEI